MDVRYVPGDSLVIVAPSAVAVLGLAAADVRKSVWDALRAGGGVADALRALVRRYAEDLGALPAFALVALTPDGAHVAVRGGIPIYVRTAEGPVDATPDPAVTLWSERMVGNALSVEILGENRAAANPGDGEFRSLELLPVECGVVLAGAVTLGLSGPEESADEHRRRALAVDTALDAGDDGPSVRSNEAGEPTARDELREVGAAASSAEPVGAPEPVNALSTMRSVEMTVDGYTGTGYGDLYGATIVRRVEDAAVRDEEDDEVAVAPEPTRSSGAGATADTADTARPAETPSAKVSEATAGPTPVIADVPGFDQSYREDHDGDTIFRSPAPAGAVASSTGVTPAQAQAGRATGPVILSRLCTQKHANPPDAARCRQCNERLRGDAVPAQRPSLGRMRLSTGAVIELEGPVVLGRSPSSRFSGAEDVPRLEAVPSPSKEISATHLSVRLDEWHVVVTDLDSSNGTVLVHPGREPRRLEPGVAELVASGDVIDLGDGVSVLFEDVP